MSDEYVKPVSDNFREQFQEMLLGSAPEQNKEAARPQFGKKNVKAEQLIQECKAVLHKNGVNTQDPNVISALAVFYQNLSKII